MTGKICRRLAVQSREHLGERGKPIVVGAPSAIKDHIPKLGHAYSLDDFNIIGKAFKGFDFLVDER